MRVYSFLQHVYTDYDVVLFLSPMHIIHTYRLKIMSDKARMLYSRKIIFIIFILFRNSILNYVVLLPTAVFIIGK